MANFDKNIIGRTSTFRMLENSKVFQHQTINNHYKQGTEYPKVLNQFLCTEILFTPKESTKRKPYVLTCYIRIMRKSLIIQYNQHKKHTKSLNISIISNRKEKQNWIFYSTTIIKEDSTAYKSFKTLFLTDCVIFKNYGSQIQR